MHIKMIRCAFVMVAARFKLIISYSLYFRIWIIDVANVGIKDLYIQCFSFETFGMDIDGGSGNKLLPYRAWKFLSKDVSLSSFLYTSFSNEALVARSWKKIMGTMYLSHKRIIYRITIKESQQYAELYTLRSWTVLVVSNRQGRGG